MYCFIADALIFDNDMHAKQNLIQEVLCYMNPLDSWESYTICIPEMVHMNVSIHLQIDTIHNVVDYVEFHLRILDQNQNFYIHMLPKALWYRTTNLENHFLSHRIQHMYENWGGEIILHHRNTISVVIVDLHVAVKVINFTFFGFCVARHSVLWIVKRCLTAWHKDLRYPSFLLWMWTLWNSWLWARYSTVSLIM